MGGAGWVEQAWPNIVDIFQFDILSGSVRQHPDHLDSDEEVLLQVSDQHIPCQSGHGRSHTDSGLSPSQGQCQSCKHHS